ncbi:MAG: GNAT family N-acetyltransferase [Alphaproteobacteria bacterium]|nr:GNAT family N-acetyltransferase [Alphaproteobacteria bacterium]
MSRALLLTPRLSLHPWRVDDAEEAWRIWGDPEVMRFVGPPHPDPARTRRALRAAIEAELTHGVCLWRVEERHTGRTVGACGFHAIAPPQGPALELAYHFRRSAWGQGYATEAARACVQLAFERLDAPRILAWTHPDNQASQRVLLKLGFQPSAPEGDELVFVLWPPLA